MRTTLELDDEVHEIVRLRAFTERRSIGDVVSELVRRGLEFEAAQRPRRKLGQFAGQIDLADDFNSLPQDLLDDFERSL